MTLATTATAGLAQTHPIVRAIIEENSERWLTEDRSLPENRIIVCIDPPRAYYLSNGYYTGVDEWFVEEASLSMSEIEEFICEFGSSWRLWLASTLGGQYPVRAFIKCGDRDWNFSVDTSEARARCGAAAK